MFLNFCWVFFSSLCNCCLVEVVLPGLLCPFSRDGIGGARSSHPCSHSRFADIQIQSDCKNLADIWAYPGARIFPREIFMGNLPGVTLWIIKPHISSDSIKQVRENRYLLGSPWQRRVEECLSHILLPSCSFSDGARTWVREIPDPDAL